MQVGSNCGAAYLQAETAIVLVRTGTAEQPDKLQPKCLTSVVHMPMVPVVYIAYGTADRRLRTKQTGHHECRRSQGSLSYLPVATTVCAGSHYV